MKETANVNIGSLAFTIDQDAYGTLRSYLNDIRNHLPGSDTETLNDIEARIAEIFRDKLGAAPMRVVTIEMVREAMMQMGSPSDFGEPCNETESEKESWPQTVETPKLRRSRTDRSIAGICGGLAAYLGTDPTLIRLITLLLIFFGGLSIWVYIILWIVIPEEPIANFSTNHKNR